MKLVIPSSELKQSYCDYINELGDEERYPFTLDLPFENFDAWLSQVNDFSQGKNLLENSVTNSTLWLVENHEIIGVTNVRHYLNTQIEHCGGHIGLSIKPSKRGKGFGKVLMAKSIEYLRSLGVLDIHIHCYKSNPASAQSIMANGGKLDSEIIEYGQVIQRFIVEYNKPKATQPSFRSP